MTSNAPSRVEDVEAYWLAPPPERSARCAWWEERIRNGWRPNRRIRTMSYDDSAQHFGVFIWEWLHVLSPLLDGAVS